MKTLLLIACAALAGCATASPPASPPAVLAAPTPLPAAPPAVDVAKLGISLPLAVEASANPAPGAPNIVLHGKQLFVDAEPAGDVTEIEASQRLTRLQGLASVLEARRQAFQARHPSEAMPRVATLWCDRTTPLLLFKSLFQTAAFAGYPSFRLAVIASASGQLGYQAFEARVPPPPSQPMPRDPFAVHVDLRADGRAQLVWKVGSRVEDIVDVTRDSLAARLEDQWQERGGHRSPSDRNFDQLVLHAPSELTLQDAARLLDAAHFPKREQSVDGKASRVPAFAVTFAIN
jgi:hypothetical protein